MTQRVFSPKCINCRQRAMALTPVPYCSKICHDGREYNINIPALMVPKCGNCGNISLDDEANRQIDLAFRREAKLFTPEEIRDKRRDLGLNQQPFADWFGVAVSTLSRWETGSQVQQRIMNDCLKAFFEVPAFREFLRVLHGIPLRADPGLRLSPVASSSGGIGAVCTDSDEDAAPVASDQWSDYTELETGESTAKVFASANGY